MKMSLNNQIKFLKALDELRDDYTCPYCSELCKKPVTLKPCLHLICEEHLGVIAECPACKKSLSDDPPFKEDGLEACIDSIKELENIFKPFRANVTLQTSNDHITTNKKKTASKSKINLVEKRNDKGETSLHHYCRLGDIDTVKKLLNLGANPNLQDNAGWIPLHEAVQNGSLDLVKLLIRHGSLINVPGLGNETPLHEAVRYNHEEIAKELVIHGACLNARNSKGETPINIASEQMKKILKDAEVNIIQTEDISSMHDFKEIRIYSISESFDIHDKLKYLLKRSNNVYIEKNFNKKVTHLIVDTDDDGVCIPRLEVLQGIVNSIWILSSKLVMEAGRIKLRLLNNYEIKGVGEKCNGHVQSRFNKYKLRPGLFNGCHFYLHKFDVEYKVNELLILNKTVLTDLITAAGGIVLRRAPNPESIPEAERLVPYHAERGSKLEICSHYIIYKDNYEPMYNMKHLKALPIQWLIDCIKNYKLIDPK